MLGHATNFSDICFKNNLENIFRTAVQPVTIKQGSLCVYNTQQHTKPKANAAADNDDDAGDDNEDDDSDDERNKNKKKNLKINEFTEYGKRCLF